MRDTKQDLETVKTLVSNGYNLRLSCTVVTMSEVEQSIPNYLDAQDLYEAALKDEEVMALVELLK